MSFDERVYEVVRRIPPGKVATYGQVAALLGNPGLARAVGSALHRNPLGWDFETGAGVPCHRVVNAAGRLAEAFAFDGAMEQRVRLEREGVETRPDGRGGLVVDLGRFGWVISSRRGGGTDTRG